MTQFSCLAIPNTPDLQESMLTTPTPKPRTIIASAKKRKRLLPIPPYGKTCPECVVFFEEGGGVGGEIGPFLN